LEFSVLKLKVGEFSVQTGEVSITNTLESVVLSIVFLLVGDVSVFQIVKGREDSLEWLTS
jgi:hypothetical protein